MSAAETALGRDGKWRFGFCLSFSFWLFVGLGVALAPLLVASSASIVGA
ncbi:hypothetical protein [Anabaena subtropica]|uniref:MFS transporter n=1 Tax=Anabaena subtropica FACHB-260 TaxID=2692884 RepID=A0ABR8CM14_9NOST|nr:hypothetical protein [Anabaena subtropica]MBD2344181.1 hypothetical protein [Anabaena subtropica FACHB-260]